MVFGFFKKKKEEVPEKDSKTTRTGAKTGTDWIVQMKRDGSDSVDSSVSAFDPNMPLPEGVAREDARRWKKAEQWFNVPAVGVQITRTGTNTFTYKYADVETKIFNAKMIMYSLVNANDDNIYICNKISFIYLHFPHNSVWRHLELRP
jgi:hypothetical protein